MKKFSCFLLLLYGEVKGQVQNSISEAIRDSVFYSSTPLLLCMNRGPPVVGLLHLIPVASVKSYFTTLKLHVYDVSLGTNIWMHQLCSTAHFNVQHIKNLHHLPSYKPLRCQDISSMAGPGSNTLAVVVSCFPLGYTRQI